MSIENIMAVKERLAEEEKAQEANAKAWAESGALTNESINYEFQNMCFEWQAIHSSCK